MKILIINGNNQSDVSTDEYCSCLSAELQNSGFDVQLINLSEIKLLPCTGCWHCWWKTPGLCSVKDDMDTVLKAYIQADLVIMVSPLVMGFPSALLKNCIDRLIPLFHPYIELHKGECHHKWRYEKYPDMAAVFEPLQDTLPGDFQISADYMKRTADHFRVNYLFTKTTDDSIKEVVYEISNI